MDTLVERREGDRDGDLLGERRRPRGLFTTVVMVSSLQEEPERWAPPGRAPEPAVHAGGGEAD